MTIKTEFQGHTRELHDLRAFLCNLLGCRKHQQQNRPPWILTLDPDEPIPKAPSPMKLSTPIKPGFRRPFTITPDEPVDVMANGAFFTAEILSGDSTVTYDPTSTAASLKGWFNGDGSVGAKSVRISVDGHLGDGEVPVTLDVDYDVTNPDATSIAALVEGVDEPIPA